MSRDFKARFEVERYRPLGLVANPFTIADAADDFNGLDLEIASEANVLLGKIVAACEQEAPKPIAVLKGVGTMPSNSNRAIGRVQRSLASDHGLNVLHSYIQLFMMRTGRVRAIIQILAERLAFTDFEKTLSLYIASVLETPDRDLIAFQMLGEEGLQAFHQRFSADPMATTRALFGQVEEERHPELADMPDVRLSYLEPNVEEADTSDELDATVGDSPANAILFGDADEMDAEPENNDQELVDYIVEYTKVHLSPVIARGLRVYRERGQIALSTELQITKAPKKTLAAIAKFARVRFKKVVLIFDGFDSWTVVPQELKAQIVSTLSEVRWLLDKDAVMVPMLEQDRVAELEEQFGGGTRVEWDFANANAFFGQSVQTDPAIMDEWLFKAAAPGADPLTVNDPVLAEILSMNPEFKDFARAAAAAIESAADRGISALDDESLAEAKAANIPEANE